MRFASRACSDCIRKILLPSVKLLPKAAREMASPVRSCNSGQTSISCALPDPIESSHRLISSLVQVVNAGNILCNVKQLVAITQLAQSYLLDDIFQDFPI